jgi:hypothetical protein
MVICLLTKIHKKNTQKNKKEQRRYKNVLVVTLCVKKRKIITEKPIQEVKTLKRKGLNHELLVALKIL